MSSVTLRPFMDADLDAVARVRLESWRSTGLDVVARATEGGNRARIRDELAAGWRVTVAVEDKRIVAFLAAKPATSALDQLFVSPDMKGRGIGAALLKRAMADMPGGFWLRTAEANVDACRFYEAHGMRRDRGEPHPLLGHATAIYLWP